MSTEAEAQAAISKLNDQSFEGRKLMVSVAKAPGSGGGGAVRWLRRPALDGPLVGSTGPTVVRTAQGLSPCAVRFRGQRCRRLSVAARPASDRGAGRLALHPRC